MSRRCEPLFPDRGTEWQDPGRTGILSRGRRAGDVRPWEPDQTASSITAGSYISYEPADGIPRRQATRRRGAIGRRRPACISVPVYVKYVCSGDIRY